MGTLRRLLACRPLLLRSSLFSPPSPLFSSLPFVTKLASFSGLPRGSHSILDSGPQKSRLSLSCVNYYSTTSELGTGGGSSSSSSSSVQAAATAHGGRSVEEEQAALHPMLMLFPSLRQYDDGFDPMVNCPFLIPSSSSSSSSAAAAVSPSEMEGDIQISQDIVVPEALRNTRCVGSSHGWLAFISTYNCALYLSSLPLTAASASIPYQLQPSIPYQLEPSTSVFPYQYPVDRASPMPLFTIQLPRITTLPHICNVEFVGDHLMWPRPSLVFHYHKPPLVFGKPQFSECFLAKPRNLSRTFVHKIILSAPPSLLHHHQNQCRSSCSRSDSTSTSTCTCTTTTPTPLVMAILGAEFRDIAFCQLAGTDSWTLLNKRPGTGGYTDIMYSQSHQQLYAIRDCDLKLEAWDFHGGDRPVMKRTHTPVPTSTNKDVLLDTCKKKHYLVESLGDILVVRRYIAHHVDHNGDIVPQQQKSNLPYGTVRFEVMQLGRENWQLVEDLGDRVLFVGLNHSVSVSAADLNLRPNSVYFADDSFDLMHSGAFRETCFTDRYHDQNEHNCGGQDFGVFNLEDGRVTGKSWKGQDRHGVQGLCVPPPVWAFLNNPHRPAA